MLVNNCRIIYGISAGIKENIEKPATLVKKNFVALQKIIDSVDWNNITRLCFVGSSCMYPLEAPQPYKELSLGTGIIEPTSSPYAYTKLMGWQLCKAISKEYGYQYFLAIPSDVYGDPDDTHVINDLIRRFHKAKTNDDKAITIWGTGSPIRTPLYDKDLEKALKFVCENYSDSDPINIAPSVSSSIATIARIIRDIVGFSGDISFDCSRPDGQAKKTLDNSRLLKLGFNDFTPLEVGLELSYKRYLNEKRTDLL